MAIRNRARKCWSTVYAFNYPLMTKGCIERIVWIESTLQAEDSPKPVKVINLVWTLWVFAFLPKKKQPMFDWNSEKIIGAYWLWQLVNKWSDPLLCFFPFHCLITSIAWYALREFPTFCNASDYQFQYYFPSRFQLFLGSEYPLKGSGHTVTKQGCCYKALIIFFQGLGERLF